MKIIKFGFCSVLVSAVLLLASCGGKVNHAFATAKTDDLIYTGAMADSVYGYAVGEDGLAFYTQDGGKNWQRSQNKCSPLFSLSPINETVCFATGEHKTFLKTTDGGKTWTGLANHPGKRSKGSSFKNENFGTVWTTSDAFEYLAATDEWEKIAKPEGCGLVESVFSIEPGKIFLCDSNGIIYSTGDYGKNWETCQKIFDKQDEIKPVTGQWVKTSEFDVSGENLRFAYLAEKNYEYSMFVYVSKDGGKSWNIESQTKLPNLAKTICFNCGNGVTVFNTDCTMDFYKLK